jgi:hypothetical protein
MPQPAHLRAALVAAHPGHECRVLGWCQRALPHIFVLTNGGGSGARLPFAWSLAERIGATPGSLFGRHTDESIYDALLAGDAALFLEWTAALSDALFDLAPDLVVVDGWQMYNVSHDLAHVMTRVAAARASVRLKRDIEVVEFDVVPRGLAAPGLPGEEAFRLELSEAEFARKRNAALAYPDMGRDLQELLALEGWPAQHLEVFRCPRKLNELIAPIDFSPPYERHGTQRVAAGLYDVVIRWNDHVRPIAASILNV